MAQRIPRDESLSRVHGVGALFSAAYGNPAPFAPLAAGLKLRLIELSMGRRNADLRRRVAIAPQLPRTAISSPRFVIRQCPYLA